MKIAKIFHNPKCSKSRTALELLKNHNFEIEVVEYLKNPPNRETLKSLLKELKLKPSQILRSKESLSSELSLNTKTEEEIFEALLENPILIERPIVVFGKHTVLARPTENLLKLL